MGRPGLGLGSAATLAAWACLAAALLAGMVTVATLVRATAAWAPQAQRTRAHTAATVGLPPRITRINVLIEQAVIRSPGSSGY